MFLLFAAFVLGSCFALGLGAAPGALAVGAFCGSALVLYAARSLRAKSWWVLLALFAFGAGASTERTPDTTLAPGLARLEGTIERERGRGSMVRVEHAEYLEHNGRPSGQRVFVSALHAPPRARVRVLVRIRPQVPFRNPSRAASWPWRHPAARASLEGEARILHTNAVYASLHAMRTSLRRALQNGLSPRAAGVARALLLGEGDALERADRQAFRQSGLAHLLAVSGLHVALFLLGLLALLRRFTRGRARDGEAAAAWLAMPFLVAFVAFAGASPSVQRAGAVGVLALLCRAARRRPRPSALLACAGLLFATTSPRAVLDPSFALSLGASAAVLSAPRGSPLVSAFHVSARATLATAPIALLCFGGLAWGAVLANVVVVPFAGAVLVPAALLHGVLAALGLDGLSAPAFEWLVDGVTVLASALDTHVEVAPLSVPQALLVGALVLALLTLRGRIRMCVALLLVGALGAEELRLRQPWNEGLRITFADVGQGDGALIDDGRGQVLLIDAAGGTPNGGRWALRPLLASRRIEVIDLAIITHPHPDHYGGVLELGVPILEAWVSGQGVQESPHGPAAAMVRELRRRGTRILTPEAFCTRPQSLGALAIDVLAPCPHFDPGYDANDNSIVVRLRYGARSVLFTGDIEAATEARLSREPRVRAELLKVPHHGSRTSSGAAFLDAVAPSFAVVSNGRLNRFGHPHFEVRQRYAQRSVPFWSTADYGGIVAQTRGRRWRLYSASGASFELAPP